MARLLINKPREFLIVAETADDLRALAKQAALTIATECLCGQCHIGSGKHGFVGGAELLKVMEQAKDYTDLLPPKRRGGLYLVTKLGHFSVRDDSMLAAVCVPTFLNSKRREPCYHVGLHYSAGGGTKPLPAPAKKLVQLIIGDANAKR